MPPPTKGSTMFGVPTAAVLAEFPETVVFVSVTVPLPIRIPPPPFALPDKPSTLLSEIVELLMLEVLLLEKWTGPQAGPPPLEPFATFPVINELLIVQPWA